MQFAVPQFTEVEDRLIARLTLRQFLVLLGAGGVILFFWSIFGPSFIFFIIATPIAIAGVGSALGRYNGRPMFTYVMPLIAFMTSNRVMVFKREEAVTTISKSKTSEADLDSALQATENPNEGTESRLKKLAYLLDNKTEEENKIIKTDFEKYVVKAKPVVMEPVKKISTVNTLSAPILPKEPAISKPAPKPIPKADQPNITPRKFDPNKIFNPNG